MTQKVFCHPFGPHHPPGGKDTPDALAGYRSAVGQLHQKLGQIASHNHQTCGHLSRAATVLRSMARNKVK